MRTTFFLLLICFISNAFSNQTLKKPLIVIDPGHGGYNIGARNKSFFLEEKRLALRTALLIKKKLEEKGYPVSLTRSRDYFLPLERRVFIANHGKGNAFISIHYNSCRDQQVKGLEIFYHSSFSDKERTMLSKQLASAVLTSTIKQTQTVSRGVKRGNFYVIRETKLPAILVEGGFLTNKEESKLLCGFEYLEKIALGIAEGIDSFYNSH